MTRTPHVLPETPAAGRAEGGDPLSVLLDTMHLAGMVLFRAEFREPWTVSTPDSRELSRLLPFRTEHIIPFHVTAEGGCWLELEGNEPVHLKEGDAVLLPYGDRHRLRGRESVRSVPVGSLLPPPPWPDIQVVRCGGKGVNTQIICGFLQCDELFFQPVLQHLPGLIHVGPTQRSNTWLANTIRYTAQEAMQARPGAGCMLPRLTELMFVEILREHMRSLPVDETGWLAAAKDPVVGAALKCLHGAPFEPWSVATLARRVGVSRSVLAIRFKFFMDQPPMRYLTHWRLQLAAQDLKCTTGPIKTIAYRAGYDSEAAFSRAFKRRFGAPPADWRRRQQMSR